MPRFLECECAEIGGHPTWANKLSKRKENEKLAGVYPNGGRFRAEHPSGGKLISLGSYDTAVEAAVAVAKYAGGAEPEEEVVVVLLYNTRCFLMAVKSRSIGKRPSGRLSR